MDINKANILELLQDNITKHVYDREVDFFASQKH